MAGCSQGEGGGGNGVAGGGWFARGCVEEMQCPRVRARTRTYARAHIGTRLKVYVYVYILCIDSVYNISIIDFFFFR